MIEIRQADPRLRRQAARLVILGTVVGALLLDAVGRYRTPLQEWILSEPEQLPNRSKLVLFSLAAALSAPLIAFAAYLWSMGERVIRSQEFPPPGQRVLHDTPVLCGKAAVLRGRVLKAFAVGLAFASIGWWLVIGEFVWYWR